ncbi:amino acid efflux transporter [Actinoplanes philippinensis]|uniref:Amino acid efflux transporter n=1 Tax=Actinoplanes philippinensis TaxID=35752 RepID=A0A1I2L408_9ACTN|nr:amino acid permease [Actinoplanes philippinensis]SFF74062.1 amino acid efflux transporter [Actinoplanes philippinensis]
MTGHRLGVWQGTATVLGGVLGPGMLVLPHLAAQAAGPGSVLAWAALLVVSVPVAFTFALLGLRHPDGGGVAHFAGKALGRGAYAAVGWWFFVAVPIGTLAGALAGGVYAADAFGWDGRAAVVIAFGLLAAALVTNAAGLRASGRTQVVMVGLLLSVLTAAIVASVPAVRAERFEPFLPHGLGGVGSAIGVLIFAFVGWEAASHLSAEFEGRRLLTATALTLVTVAVIYLGVAVTVVGSGAASSPVPLTAMTATGLGAAAGPVTGIAALVLTFGAVNTYLAGASRLGVALAGQRLLPHRIATPHRSLTVLGAAIAVLGAAVLVLPVGLDPLLRATSACLAAVMFVGALAAVRLLPGGWTRATAVAGSALTAATLALSGIYLLVPAGIALAGFAARGVRVRSVLNTADRPVDVPGRAPHIAGKPTVLKGTGPDGSAA